MNTPTISQLHQALTIAEQIQKLEAELASILGGSSAAPKTASVPAPVKTGKRIMSVAARARIAAAQKARWAKVKAAAVAPAKASPKATPTPVKKGGFSSAHKTKLAAAAKKRWAAIKAGKAANPFGAKKAGK